MGLIGQIWFFSMILALNVDLRVGLRAYVRQV